MRNGSVTTNRSVETRRASRWSRTGIVQMIVGLGMVLFELQSQFMLERLGVAGRGIVLICGTSLSVWGLKEVIIGLFPQFGRSGTRFNLPTAGWAYLVICCVLFTGALIGRSNLLLMVFAVLVGPFVVNGGYAFTMLKGVAVERRLPRRAMSGELFTVTTTLRNRRSFLSLWLMNVRDQIHVPATQDVFEPDVLYFRVPASGERRGHYRVRLLKRGRYEFGPLTVTTAFPLGLVERGLVFNLSGEILIYPRIGRLHPRWRKQLRHSTELVSQIRPQQGAFNDDLHQLREYRAGDDPRTIHWRTSARMNDLMVREYRENRDRDLLVIVDAYKAPGASPSEVDAIESGISFALTICFDHLRDARESGLTVLLYGRERTAWRGEASGDEVESLLDHFALIEPAAAHQPQAILNAQEDTRSRRTVIVTSRPSEIHRALQTSSQASSIGSSDAQVFGCQPEELAEFYVQT